MPANHGAGRVCIAVPILAHPMLQKFLGDWGWQCSSAWVKILSWNPSETRLFFAASAPAAIAANDGRRRKRTGNARTQAIYAHRGREYPARDRACPRRGHRVAQEARPAG